MKQVLLSASSNCGTGLWTSICVMFSNIFGCKSDHYMEKQRRIVSEASNILNSSFEKLGPGYVLSDFRVVMGKGLSVTVSAIATFDENQGNSKDLENTTTSFSNEALLSLMRNSLNDLFNLKPYKDVIDYLHFCKNDILNEFAFELSKAQDQLEAVKISKEFITNFKANNKIN